MSAAFALTDDESEMALWPMPTALSLGVQFSVRMWHIVSSDLATISCPWHGLEASSLAVRLQRYQSRVIVAVKDSHSRDAKANPHWEEEAHLEPSCQKSRFQNFVQHSCSPCRSICSMPHQDWVPNNERVRFQLHGFCQGCPARGAWPHKQSSRERTQKPLSQKMCMLFKVIKFERYLPLTCHLALSDTRSSCSCICSWCLASNGFGCFKRLSPSSINVDAKPLLELAHLQTSRVLQRWTETCRGLEAKGSCTKNTWQWPPFDACPLDESQ